jgi:BASS family bile acid:Na+ symporter
MLFLRAPVEALAWLGLQGTRAVAALVVVGIAVPWIGAQLRPHVTGAVFVLLCIAFLRVDTRALASHVRRPALALAATAWTSLAIPLLAGVAGLASGLDRRDPEIFLALMLQAVASPMMAAPALAALMGLDATLVLVTLVASTALVPLTAPLFAYLFVGPDLALAPLALAGRLLAILAGAAAVGWLARRLAGAAVLERHHEAIDGLNIFVLFVFVAAVMSSVGVRFIDSPMTTIALAALAFAIFLAVLIVTTLLFLAAGRERALALGFTAAQRNMGLMLAGTGGVLPDLAWLYFALSQFPIYLSPALLKPLARRFIARAPGSARPGREPPAEGRLPLLFSYGSLQEESVQLATFGRLLHGQSDALLDCAPSLVRIDDPNVAAAIGRTHHANVILGAGADSRVPGMVFEITDAELVKVDAYEAAYAYERVAARLASGREAWVYVHVPG